MAFLKLIKFNLNSIGRRLISSREIQKCVLKDFKVGDKITICRSIGLEDIQLFSEMTGDFNPIHSKNEESIVHGAFLNGLVSGVIGTKLPGPGTLVLEQMLKFPNKCYANDIVQITVELLEIRKIMKVSFNCVVDNKIVMEGQAKLMFQK